LQRLRDALAEVGLADLPDFGLRERRDDFQSLGALEDGDAAFVEEVNEFDERERVRAVREFDVRHRAFAEAVVGHPDDGDVPDLRVFDEFVLEAGRVPDLALVDERTKRATVDDEVSDAVTDDRFDRVVTVSNPPATLTAALLEAIVTGLGDGTTLVRVDGEEDLAALPAIAAARDGASVLYGQPDEGVVHVTVDDEVRERVSALLEAMDGDSDRAFGTLGVDRD